MSKHLDKNNILNTKVKCSINHFCTLNCICPISFATQRHADQLFDSEQIISSRIRERMDTDLQ